MRLIDDGPPGRFPKQFRTFKTILESSDYTSNLNIWASGQFSKLNLEEIFRDYHDESKRTLVVDLRQETHLFLDSMPVSFYCPYNWSLRSEDKESCQVDLYEKKQILQRMPYIEISDKENTHSRIQNLENVNIRTEKELTALMGLEYVWIPIPDHCRPDDAAVILFLEVFDNKTVEEFEYYIHCRAGKGRTTTILTMIDMLMHPTHQFPEILERQSKFGANMFPNETNFDKPYKRKEAQERFDFLAGFHDFLQVRRTMKWTEFVQKTFRFSLLTSNDV